MHRQQIIKLISIPLQAMLLLISFCVQADERVRIKAVGIPLADHYAGIVAYEKYRHEMKYADYQLLILPGPNLVRAYFRSEPDADIAFNVSPMVMDMFANNPDFRWVSLIHRDGNALAINEAMNKYVNLDMDRKKRLPDSKIANAISQYKQETGTPLEIAIPHPLATHTTILYKYLKDHGKTFGLHNQDNTDVTLRVVKPADAPLFIKKQSARSKPAIFEQSLPWAELVETNHYGYVGWYSKDVMQHELGHVECIIIAKNDVIAQKNKALKEVIHFIHKAGRDIEHARHKGGDHLDEIIQMVQRHIPQHSKEAIIESLRPDINAINYLNLNVDDNSKNSFREIMELAHEAKLIKQTIDIEQLADEQFSTTITHTSDE